MQLNRCRLIGGKRRVVFLAGLVWVAGLTSGVVGRDLNQSPATLARVPNWKDLPGVDGKRHSLADLEPAKVVVVVITCNHCPIAMQYYDRMKAFVRQQQERAAGRVALVAISVSDLETDKLPRMKEMAQRQQFNFPYLQDASKGIVRQLQATVTPQCFVLDQQRAVVYRGAWDDSVNPARVTNRYVEDAVTAVLAGKKPLVAETKARGCLID
ncbi:MAG: thioredoxin family protein [Planctomycetota bacterium]